MTGEMITMRPEQLSIRQVVELTNLTETELKKICFIQENL